jgi:beta-barrel assembly-enhancing protease
MGIRSLLQKRLVLLLTATTVSSVFAVNPAATLAQSPAQNSHPTFVRAKRELKPELYTMYRIIDLLSRANGLHNTAWRIQVLPEYNT